MIPDPKGLVWLGFGLVADAFRRPGNMVIAPRALAGLDYVLPDYASSDYGAVLVVRESGLGSAGRRGAANSSGVAPNSENLASRKKGNFHTRHGSQKDGRQY
jgi:hypothetical protein